MFSEYLSQFPWEETAERIHSKTGGDVRRALSKRRLQWEDFLALISPAAAPCIETMARLSRKITEERFGRTMNLFLPLYLSNSCANSCVYCGFHRQNRIRRIVLTEDEILREYKAIKELAPFDSILLLTGENPAKAGVGYIARAIDMARPYFHNIKAEVMPLSAEDYATLVRHGCDGIVCFQETYRRESYGRYHPAGRKADFEWRADAPDRMAAAGVRSIGLGALIGLEEWRTDIAMLALHLRYLEKNYWKTQYGVNFPRMRPAENGGFQPNVIMSDRELAQATFAMRIFDPDVDISYSTREPPSIRDAMSTLGVTTMSAGSRTEPGGYCCYPQSLEQFSKADTRTPRQIEEALLRLGRAPVYKNWDNFYGKPGA